MREFDEGDQPERARQQNADDGGEDAGAGERPHQAVDLVLVLRQHQRPRLHAVQHQYAQEHRHLGAGGNAEGDGGDERAAILGVDRGFRRDHALDIALAEAFGIVGGLHGHAVGQERRDGAALAGNGAHQRADDRAAQHGAPVPEGRLHAAHHAGDLHRAQVLRHRAAGDRQVDHLGDREQPDQGRDQMHAVPQIFDAPGEAGGSGDAVIADGRDHQADAPGEEAAQHPAAQAAGDGDEGEDRQQEEFRRPEQEDELFCHRQHREHRHRADDSAERIGGGRGADRVSRLALLGQRIAVEAGRGIGRRARRVQEDRGERAAHRHRTHHAAGQRDGGEGFEAIGQRHQQRQRGGAAEPRQRAEHEADGHAEAQEHQLPDLQAGPLHRRPTHPTWPTRSARVTAEPSVRHGDEEGQASADGLTSQA